MFFLTPTNVGKISERGTEKGYRENNLLFCCFLRKLYHCIYILPQTTRQSKKPLTECQEYSERCWKCSVNHKIVVTAYWAMSWPEPRLPSVGGGSEQTRPVAMGYQWALHSLIT